MINLFKSVPPKLGRLLIEPKSINEIYKNALIGANEQIRCRKTLLYILTKESLFNLEIIYSKNDNNILLKESYERNESWMKDAGGGDNNFGNSIIINSNDTHIIATPLSNSYRTFGVLVAVDKLTETGEISTNGFNEDDLAVLENIAYITSHYASNIKKRKKIEFVFDTFDAVKHKTNKKEIFQILANQLTSNRSKYNGCIIHLHDDVNNNLYGFVSSGLTYKKEGSSRVEIGKNIIGEVFVNGETLVAQTDTEDFIYHEWAKKNNFVSMISIQLKDISNKAYGTISLFTKYRYEIEEDKNFIDRFMNQTSNVINGILNYEKIKKLEHLENIITRIIPFEKTKDEILHIFLEESLTRLNGEIGYITLFSKQMEEVQADIIIDQTKRFPNVCLPQNFLLENRDTLASWVFKNKKSYFYPSDKEIDTFFRPYDNLNGETIESEIIVPINYENAMIGLMTISSTKRHAFDHDDLVFLESIANNTSQVLVSKGFFDGSRSILNEFKYKMTNEDSVAQETARLTSKVLNVPTTCVWIIEKNEDNEEILVLRGNVGCKMPSDFKNTIHRKERGHSWSVIEEARKNKFPSFCKPFQDIQSPSSGYRHPSFAKMNGLKSMLSVAIIAEDQVLGVINAYSKKSSDIFDTENILLQNISIRCAEALINSKLYVKNEVLRDKLLEARPGIIALSFVHDMAHEIHYLNSDVDLLDSFIPKESKNYPSIEKVLNSIVGHSDYLSKSLKSLVKIGKSTKSKMRKIDIIDIIDDLEHLFRRKMEANRINFKVDIENGHSEVVCYPDSILQVFTNLMFNSLTALEGVTHRRKEISITAKTVEREIQYLNGTKWLLIKFMDNGIGIPLNFGDQIYSSTFTTKGEEGSGFGLSICKKIIEHSHQGKIEHKSNFGENTTFIIYLPLEKAV